MDIPTHLSDSGLIEALARCATCERGATADLVAHLAEMDARQLHLGAGFSSLFGYCCEMLRLSESAAYKRIEVARAVRRYPLVLDYLASGSLNLATARLLAPHLTPANHEVLLEAAAGLSKRAVEELVAMRFPRPDVVALVRKLPTRPLTPVVSHQLDPPDDPEPPASAASRPIRPVVTALAPDRYQIRFTACEATRRKLRVAQDLLRHDVPDGDPAEIFDRALTALIANLQRQKLAAVGTPARAARLVTPGSRHIPARVRREVWARDQARCAFVASSGWRCRERGFLEFHHVTPYAVGGAATVVNIQLRCRAHNAHESRLFFGSRDSTGPGAGRREEARPPPS